jgi:hypothetical protein
MNGKVTVSDFVTEAFDYRSILNECSIDRSVNRYLLEYIAYGFAKYGNTTQGFIDHVDEWIRMLIKIYPEIGFDHQTHQIKATIDLVDQLVVVDDELVKALEFITAILTKYGLLITYSSKKRGINQTTTLLRFFEYIEGLYPVIKDRHKGLGSSAAIISKEVLMDPKTRRMIRVTKDDAETIRTMSILMGDGKENIRCRKKLLTEFKFDKSMIDN